MMYFSSATNVFLLLFTSLVVGFEDSDVTFYLFTSENPEISRENATVDADSRVIFLVHGWEENRSVSWYQNLKNAFLAKPTKTSVIQVDWSKPASQFYPNAVYDCTKTGQIIAEFIIKLVENHNVSINKVHIVGHSLGAHVAGFAGKSLQNSGFKLSRITGLDPAGIFFQYFWIPDTNRLSKNDAEVLVVIHTDSWKFGYFGCFGAVDIFPNGRPLIQPGCPDNKNWLMCSHQRSHQFFIDALEHPGTLVASRCSGEIALVLGWCKGNKRVDLGGEFSQEDVGQYYLPTNSKKPYGKGP